MRSLILRLSMIWVWPQVSFAAQAEVYHNDFYPRLGINPTAPQSEVIEAAKRLLGLYHARAVNSGAKTDPIEKLLEAVSTLALPSRRGPYDASLGKTPPDTAHYGSEEIGSAAVVDFQKNFSVPTSAPSIGLVGYALEGDEREVAPYRAPQTPAASLSLSSTAGTLESVADRLERNDIFLRTQLYREYLALLKDSILKKRDRVAPGDDVFAAQLTHARIQSFPGFILGAGICLTPLHPVSEVVGGLGIAGDLCWKIWAKRNLTVKLRKLREAFFLKPKSYLQPLRLRAKGTERAKLTELANAVLAYDTWSEILFPRFYKSDESRLTLADRSEQEIYANLYEHRWPLEDLELRFFRDFFPEALPGFLFRHLQSESLSNYLPVFQRDPIFWALRLAELRHAMEEQKAQELEDEIELVDTQLQQLQIYAHGKGSGRQAIQWIHRQASSCASYTGHVWNVLRSMGNSN